MGKDNEFKNSISVLEYTPLEFESEFDPKYAPDSVYGDDNTEYILESSSTSDRKVHIGELIQFLTYVSTSKNRKPNYFFILFLCGEADNSPRADLECKRLKTYFDNFPMTETIKSSIAGVYVVDQKTVSMKLTQNDFLKMQTVYVRANK